MPVSEGAELLGAVRAVVTALERHEVRYFITGSFASSVQGEFRATNDLDVVAGLAPAQLEPLFHDFAHDFVVDIDQARSALGSSSSFNLIHRVTYLKVDVFPCLTPFDREATRRAESIAISPEISSLRVATREDILLAKIRWYSLGGEISETQRRDIQRLVALNEGEFDESYLRHWAARLNVSGLLKHFVSAGG